MIGIGAGAGTDGQVLVFHDLLGIHSGHRPKFVKRYAELHDAMVAGVGAYATEVRSRSFPGPEHSTRSSRASSRSSGAISTRRAWRRPSLRPGLVAATEI